MDFIRAAIENPVKVTVGVIVVVLFGIVGVAKMPIQLAPEVEVPRIGVETFWQGASPAEVEQEIVNEQEEQLNTTEGLVKLESESRDGEGRIILEFPVGSDIDANMLLVNNRLNQVKEYPANVDQPVISKVDAVNNRPIAWFMLRPIEDGPLGDSAPTAGRVSNIEFERTFAEDHIEPELEKITGVAAANTLGGRERRLEVIVDAQKLAARQITITQLRDALMAQNKDTSGGDLWEGKRRWILRTIGQFRSPEQVESVIVARRDGIPVYVRDVATVRLGYKKPDSITRQKRNKTIAMNVLRSTGSNVLEVMAALKTRVAELNEGLLKDRGLELVQVYDETEYIVSAISLVRDNIITASILTIITLLLFLRSAWPTIIIALAIPASIIGTFFIFSSVGRTLNVISLAGMAFAVGMVVDNAIVVMENIYRHFEMGKSPVQAALDGAREVWGAVVASTLTTLAVFLPVIFVQEEAGQLFRDIAIAISCAVGLSMLVSITVIPTASARILRRGMKMNLSDGNGRSEGNGKPQRGLGAWFVNLIVGINRMVNRTVTARVTVIVASVALSVVGSWFLMPRTEYLPEGNRNLIIGLLLPPPGYNLEQMIEIGKKVEDKLEPYWGPDFTYCKERGLPGIERFFFVARGRQLFMGASSTEPDRAAELIPVLREAVSDIPGMIPVVLQTSLFEGALAGGRSLDIEITGDDLGTLVKLGGQVFGQVMASSRDRNSAFFESQVRPIPSLDLSNPEVHVVPKWEESADLGLTARDLGYTVDALVDGAYAGDFYEGNDKIDLDIVGTSQAAARTDQLDELYIATPQGHLTPLGAVANISMASGPEQINHRQRRRAITIQVKPSLKVPLDLCREAIETQIIAPLREAGQLQGGRYQINVAGTADKLALAWSAMWFNLVLAGMITYLLMAGLFESFLHPLVIMLSVPLAAVGGFVALFGTSQATFYFLNSVTSLDIVTMLGFVILIGTVVNNPILIVHQALNHIREDGMDPHAAVVESARTRIRPIFMTTGTTVLGLLPLVVMPGAGSEIYRGLGSVVLGGLVCSTLVTLVVVPSAFTLAMDLQLALSGMIRRRKESRAAKAVVAPAPRVHAHLETPGQPELEPSGANLRESP